MLEPLEKLLWLLPVLVGRPQRRKGRGCRPRVGAAASAARGACGGSSGVSVCARMLHSLSLLRSLSLRRVSCHGCVGLKATQPPQGVEHGQKRPVGRRTSKAAALLLLLLLQPVEVLLTCRGREGGGEKVSTSYLRVTQRKEEGWAMTVKIGRHNVGKVETVEQFARQYVSRERGSLALRSKGEKGGKRRCSRP